MTPDALTQLIVRGNREALRIALAPLTEPQRSELAPHLLKVHAIIDENWGPSGAEMNSVNRKDPQVLELVGKIEACNPAEWRMPRWTAHLAMIGICDLKELKKYHGSWYGSDLRSMPQRILQILDDRRPPWLADWMKHFSKDKDYRIGAWPIERGLIRSGALPQNQDETYIQRMVNDLTAFIGSESSIEVKSDALNGLPTSLGEYLLADPELLQNEVWRLFEVQTTAFDATWSEWLTVLPELCNKGHLDRARLLQASARAMQNAFRPAAMNGYVRFHEALAPTVDERKALKSDYLALLGSSTPAIAGTAIDALESLIDARSLSAAEFLDACPPAFRSQKKGPSLKVLKLIKRLLKDDPKSHPLAVRPLISALAHESPDVQEMAVGLLQTIRNSLTPDDHNLLKDAAEHVAAVLRTTVHELSAGAQNTDSEKPAREKPIQTAAVTGKKAKADTSAGANEGEAALQKRISAISPELRQATGIDAALQAITAGMPPIPTPIEPRSAPRLDPGQAIAPVASVDELIDTIAAFIEKVDDVIQVERILDGISRFTKTRGENFEKRVAPLCKRIESKGEGFNETIPGVAARFGLMQLIRKWLMMPSMPPDRYLRGHWRDLAYRFFRGRIDEVSWRLDPEKVAVPLLALPTQRDGWIDPLALVDRLKEYLHAKAIVSNNYDIAQALLRLAPDHHAEARNELAKLKTEDSTWYIGNAVQALQFALGEPVELSWATRGLHCEARCLAAAQARVHMGYPLDKPLPFTLPAVVLQRDGTARFSGPFTEDPSFPGALLLQTHDWIESSDERSWGCPPDKLSDWLVEWQNMVWPANRAPVCLLASVCENSPSSLKNLLDPDATWGDDACRLAALATGTAQAVPKQIVTDALVEAFGQRTVDPVRLGEQLSLVIGELKLNRVAAVLAEAARISPLHQWCVFTVVDTAIGKLTEAPRDLQQLLTPLLEAATTIGCPVSEATRAVLTPLAKGSSKTAKLASQVLAVTANNDLMITVREQALEAAVVRAERWAKLTR